MATHDFTVRQQTPLTEQQVNYEGPVNAGNPDVAPLADEYVKHDAAALLGPCVVQQTALGFERREVSQAQAQILTEIADERQYQDSIYGEAHDRTMSEELWLKVLHDYTVGLGRAKDYNFETRMLKGAAICVAAVEWFRNQPAQ